MAEGESRNAVFGQEVPFGGRLRRLRETAGLTQEELASRAGLTAKAISMLERGERKRPYPHTVRSLADALGISEGERAVLAGAIPKRTSGDGVAPVLDGEEAPTAAHPSALPASLTPLLGREREVGEIAGLLLGRSAAAAVRLLTLTGPGGIGKTRLGVEAARKAGGHYFPDGVAFVALAPLNDAALVKPTVSRALGLREAAGVPPLEALRQYLREKKFLLVLDNFEHVTEAAPEVVDLLGSCPNLSLLVTSRAPLRVRGEREYPVSPLTVPDPTRMPEAEEVAEAPAAELFIERAGEASPSFELTQANAAAVAAICWRLEGLPLALELAAAQTRFLGPTALLSRLDQALHAGGARDLPERQRTMRATLDWSHELLHEPERELFKRLSVFAGGFTLEAAEDVGAAGALEAEDVLVLVGNLAEQSLVVAETSPEGRTRYRMLEPVRQYAQKLLEESGEAEEVKQRHAGYYLALAEWVGPRLRGPDQAAGVKQLETELDNLRADLRWTIDHGKAEAVARMAWASWTFWWFSGRPSEGRGWVEEALEKEPHLPAPARAKLLFVASTLAWGLSDFEPARLMAEESLAIFRRMGDENGIAHALGTAGFVALGQERREEGLALLEESADLGLKLGEKWVSSACLGFAAMGALDGGDPARAQRLAERGLSLAREVGARDVIYVTLHALAAVAWTEDDRERAGRLFEEGLRLSAESGEVTNVCFFLEKVAAIAASEGRLTRAARMWGAAEAIQERTEAVAYPYALDRSLYHSQVTAAREQLDEEAWAEAWSEGRAMTFEQAVEYAIEADEALPT